MPEKQDSIFNGINFEIWRTRQNHRCWGPSKRGGTASADGSPVGPVLSGDRRPSEDCGLSGLGSGNRESFHRAWPVGIAKAVVAIVGHFALSTW